MGKYLDQMKKETIQPFGWSLGAICDKLEADIAEKQAKLTILENKLIALDQTVAKCCGGGGTLTEHKPATDEKPPTSEK